MAQRFFVNLRWRLAFLPDCLAARAGFWARPEVRLDAPAAPFLPDFGPAALAGLGFRPAVALEEGFRASTCGFPGFLAGARVGARPMPATALRARGRLSARSIAAATTGIAAMPSTGRSIPCMA